jgi:hypothetical protein
MSGMFAQKPEGLLQALASQQIKPKEPPPIPDSMSPEVREARRREQMRIMQRGGRASTILSAPEGRAAGGAPAYSATTLGSA